MTSKRLNIAICGMGRAGHIHLGNCLQNYKIHLKYIVELDTKKADEIKEQFHLNETVVVHADDFQKIVLDDPAVSGVIIATVTDTHEHYVNQCIEAKKAIFCEKPIASNLKDTISCYESAERAGVPIFCAFNRRFDPSHSAVKAAVDNNEIGKVHMVKVCSRDSPLPSAAYLKISGGIFHDCAVHDIDMSMWMLKESPISVFTHAHAFRQFIADMDDVDTVSITMKFPSGSMAQIDLSRLAAYGYDQRVEVFGERGMLESENHNKTTVRKSLSQSVSKDLIDYSFPTRYKAAYAAEIDHFIDVMNGTAASLITKTDVAMVSLVASACEESYRSGKPIKIDKEKMSFEAAC